MGSTIYENWGRLVKFVQQKEKDDYLAHCPSISSSSSLSSSMTSSFNYRSIDNDDSHDLQERANFILGAREINITWGPNPAYWSYISHPASRFSEVAKLNAVCWLDINCKVDTKKLTENTSYGAYLVFKLTDSSYGLQSVHGYVRFVNRETRPKAENRASLLHLLQPYPSKTTGQVARPRTDGWMEIKLGDFITNDGKGGPVEARLLEISNMCWKSGLIVEGIEFRPN